MSADLFLLNNTMVVELDELHDDLNLAYLTGSAEVQLTVKKDGNDVTGETWPKAMTYIGVNGKFRVLVGAATNFEDGAEYDVLAEVSDATTGFVGEWNDVVTARKRGTN